VTECDTSSPDLWTDAPNLYTTGQVVSGLLPNTDYTCFASATYVKDGITTYTCAAAEVSENDDVVLLPPTPPGMPTVTSGSEVTSEIVVAAAQPTGPQGDAQPVLDLDQLHGSAVAALATLQRLDPRFGSTTPPANFKKLLFVPPASATRPNACDGEQLAALHDAVDVFCRLLQPHFLREEAQHALEYLIRVFRGCHAGLAGPAPGNVGPRDGTRHARRRRVAVVCVCVIERWRIEADATRMPVPDCGEIRDQRPFFLPLIDSKIETLTQIQCVKQFTQRNNHVQHQHQPRPCAPLAFQARIAGRESRNSIPAPGRAFPGWYVAVRPRSMSL